MEELPTIHKSEVKEADGNTPSARFSKDCEVTIDNSCPRYPDGSWVVKVKDHELNCIVLMRQWPNGHMIPLDQDF